MRPRAPAPSICERTSPVLCHGYALSRKRIVKVRGITFPARRTACRRAPLQPAGKVGLGSRVGSVPAMVSNTVGGPDQNSRIYSSAYGRTPGALGKVGKTLPVGVLDPLRRGPMPSEPGRASPRARYCPWNHSSDVTASRLSKPAARAWRAWSKAIGFRSVVSRANFGPRGYCAVYVLGFTVACWRTRAGSER